MLSSMQDQGWELVIIQDLRNPLLMLQLKVIVGQAMRWLLLRRHDTAPIRHVWGSVFLGQSGLNGSNRCCYRLHQGIEKRVQAACRHDLVEQFQGREQDLQAAAGPRCDGNKPPALLMEVHLAAKLAHEVVLPCLSDLPWRGIPAHAGTDLPDIGVEPGEKGQHRMEVRLNGFGREAVVGLFAKDGQRQVKAITAIKDQKGMVVLGFFGPRGKPIRLHPTKTPFNLRSSVVATTM